MYTIMGMSQEGHDSKSARKSQRSLIALSSAAVLAIYSAGYYRTKSAADRFAVQAADHGPALPTADGTAHLTAAAFGGPAPTTAAAFGGPPAMASHADPVAASPAPGNSAAPKEMAMMTSPVAPSAQPEAAKSEAPRTEAKSEAPAPVAAAAPVAAPVAPTPAPAAPAPAAVVAAAPAAAPAASAWKDGTYLGWGTCRHGDIQAQVVAEACLTAVAGGSVGVGVAIAAVWGLATALDLAVAVRPTTVLIGLVAATVAGTLAGWYPARRAVRQDVIASIRSE